MAAAWQAPPQRSGDEARPETGSGSDDAEERQPPRDRRLDFDPDDPVRSHRRRRRGLDRVDQERPARHRRLRLGVAVLTVGDGDGAVLSAVIVNGNVLGDLWDWVVGVVERIGDVSVYWLALALALKTAESAFIGLSWRNILRVAYPQSGLSFKTAWAASQGGTAINAVAPAQAGTLAMIGIFRTSITGSSVAGLAAATAAQALFFTAVSVSMLVGVAVLLPRVVSKGSPSDETGGFFLSHPVLVPAVVVAAIVILIVLWPRLKPRLREQWRKGKQGLAIFSDWRRYAREVALPSGASYCCRIGVNVVFMAAFDIPVTVYTVALVASSHMLSGLFAITPGGVGQTQALDVATLGRHAPTANVAAFSVTQDSVLMIWNVVLGVALMLWAFGYAQTRQLLSRTGRKQAQPRDSA